MIKPTVGRMLHFYPRGRAQLAAGEQPLSAQIARVHSDRCVNIGYLDADGAAHNATSVRLLQDEDEAPITAFCQWMDFQKGQAAKTEAAEKTALELGAAARRHGPSNY